MTWIINTLPCTIKFENGASDSKPYRPLVAKKLPEIVNIIEGMDLSDVGNQCYLILHEDKLSEFVEGDFQLDKIIRVIFVAPIEWVPSESHMIVKNKWDYIAKSSIDWNALVKHKNLANCVNSVYSTQIDRLTQKLPYERSVELAKDKVNGLNTEELINQSLVTQPKLHYKTKWEWE